MDPPSGESRARPLQSAVMSEPLKIGCVSYLNSKPLIEPLLDNPAVKVHFAVPAALLDLISRGEVCCALLPMVDYQASDLDLLLLPVGGIACDGPTLTVRIFSRVPPQRITHLYADTDSHTSVILAQVILREFYGVRPAVIPLAADSGNNHHSSHESVLLIGDKVVNAAPPPGEFPWQLDLGQQWKQFTGLPFVFAMWMMRADIDPGKLPHLLREAREKGTAMTDELVNRYAQQRHWPRDLAYDYFTTYLQYSITSAARNGIETFYALAQKHGLLVNRRPLRYFQAD